MTDTTATYSFVTLRTEDWSQTEFRDRDGKRYRVEGYIWDETRQQYRCPTEKCGGLCCQHIPLIGSIGRPCPHWNPESFGCGFEEAGGKSAKPVSCVVWPRRQADVDMVNERFADGERRCYLKVVEVNDG